MHKIDILRFLSSTMGCGKTYSMLVAIKQYLETNDEAQIVIQFPCEKDIINYQLKCFGIDRNKVKYLYLSDVIKQNKKYVDGKDPRFVTKPLPRGTFISHEVYEHIIRNLIDALSIS